MIDCKLRKMPKTEPLYHSFVGKVYVYCWCLHKQMEMNNLETDVRGGIA